MLEEIASGYKAMPSIVRKQINQLAGVLGEDPLYIGAIVAGFVKLAPQEEKSQPYQPSHSAIAVMMQVREKLRVNYGAKGAVLSVDPVLVDMHHQQLFDALDSIVDQLQANLLTFRCGRCKMVHQLGFDVAVDLLATVSDSKICAFCDLRDHAFMISHIPNLFRHAELILQKKDTLSKVILAIPEGVHYQIFPETVERFRLRLHTEMQEQIDIFSDAVYKAGLTVEKVQNSVFLVHA